MKLSTPRIITSLKNAICIVSLVSFAPCTLASGGDGFSENGFIPEYHIALSELDNYSKDNLRLIAPTYWRVYQFIAYRALVGHPISKEELELMNIDGWRVGVRNVDYRYSYDAEKNGVNLWLEARKIHTSVTIKGIEVDKYSAGFSDYLNCPRDAFLRASSTLKLRYAQYDAKWAAQWLSNQDSVFANCAAQAQLEGSQGTTSNIYLPPVLASSAPEWLKKDHAYQTASALFYAGRFDEARQKYSEIAKDKSSPWQSLAPYLAARCLIRKATLLPEPQGETGNQLLDARMSLLKTAASELSAISSSYAPARNLLTWVDIRLRPEERREEISRVLARDKIDENAVQQLQDYLFLLDKIEGAPMLNAQDDMTAWIGIMQTTNNPYKKTLNKDNESLRKIAMTKAKEFWKKSHAAHWLVALLSNARLDELSEDELKAASILKEDSPAFGMVRYALARGNIMQGKYDQGDKLVSAMLKKPLVPSVRNQWLRLKMVAAKTVEDFFKAAPRSIIEDQRDAPVTNEGKVEKTALTFDDDTTQHLTQHFSLPMLKKYKALIPAEQQGWINELIWTRAVILEDFSSADEVTDELMKGRSTTSHLYQQFRKTTLPKEKKDAAILILANSPELIPYIRVQENNYRGGSEVWSCADNSNSFDDMENRVPAFVTTEMRSQIDKERLQLNLLPKRSSYLIPLVIEWAKKNKSNPEAPKALHFLIASTRKECNARGGDQAKERNYSREAFEFLHSQFSKSEWTKSTKYYY